LPKPTNVIAFPVQTLDTLPTVDEVLEMTEQETADLIDSLR
jgi:hypothetical protein